MTKLLRGALLVTFMSCGGGSSTPCSLTWEGELTGMGDCSNTAGELLLATGNAPRSLNWQVASDNTTHEVNFLYQVPNPPGDAYEGGTSEVQFCQVSLTPKADGSPMYSAFSRPSTTGTAPRGSCRISFTSKTDDSSATTTRYTVHGIANATLAAVNDEAKTVTLTVTF